MGGTFDIWSEVATCPGETLAQTWSVRVVWKSSRQKVSAQIATIQAQLGDEPNAIIVQQAGRTLRNITEGAIASLIATAVQPTVWRWVALPAAGWGMSWD
jgi:hypothetical protein